MFFTEDDYKKIQQWLTKNSVKDTEFNEASIPFNGEEIITIVQGNQNKRIFLKDLIAQVFNLGVSDFVNITDKYDAPNISLEEAIRLIPSRARKEGQVITFLDKEDHWHIYQFKGALNQWNVLDTWEDLFDWEKLIINSILPDEEDLTKSLPDANGNSYLSLKDREYNPEDFSGLGRIILRKNIMEVEDPIYGRVKKNILYQDMFTQSNTIYEIRYDFTLNGNITIPANCVLEFDGGSISGNYSLTGQDTKIINSSNSYIFKLTSIVGINIEKLPLSWCGGVADYNETNNTGTDNSAYLLKALTLASTNGNIPVFIDGNYFCATQINISVPLSLQGNYTAKEGKPTGSGYNSRIIVATNITLFNITGYNEYWYQIDLRGIAFKGTNKSSTLITSSVSMGPARPHRIESCEAQGFYRVFEFIVPSGKETNFFNASVFNNVFVQNYEVIYSSGKDAIGNIHIFDNVIEHNGLDANDNITSNGVLCLSALGACIIENNLLEGQPNAINISFVGAQIKITDNYFESNTGDYTIQINKSGRLQSHATIMRNANYNSSCRINVYSEFGYLDLDSDELTNNYLYVKNVNLINIDNLLASHIESSLTIPVDTALVGNNPKCVLPTSFLLDLPGRRITRSGIDCFKCNYSNPSTVYVTYNNLNIASGKVVFLMVYAQREDDLDGTNPITVKVNNEYYTEFGQYSLNQKRIWLCRITKDVVINKIEIISNNQGIISPIGFYIDFPESVLNMRIPKFEDWFAPYFIQHGETAARPPLSKDYISLWNGWKFFDDTLGKPIWWNDTAWVDATGQTV